MNSLKKSSCYWLSATAAVDYAPVTAGFEFKFSKKPKGSSLF